MRGPRKARAASECTFTETRVIISMQGPVGERRKMPVLASADARHGSEDARPKQIENDHAEYDPVEHERADTVPL